MASWIDQLSDHGKKRKRTKKVAQFEQPPEAPRGPVHECYITIRNASENDPGAVEACFFIVHDGMLTLTDANGKPLKDAKPEPIGQAEPRSVAGRLMRARRLERDDGDFGRPLNYRPLRWR